MTRGYEFFEYDYIDLDEEIDSWDDLIGRVTNRDEGGRFIKGSTPWNKGMRKIDGRWTKIGIYEDYD